MIVHQRVVPEARLPPSPTHSASDEDISSRGALQASIAPITLPSLSQLLASVAQNSLPSSEGKASQPAFTVVKKAAPSGSTSTSQPNALAVAPVASAVSTTSANAAPNAAPAPADAKSRDRRIGLDFLVEAAAMVTTNPADSASKGAQPAANESAVAKRSPKSRKLTIQAPAPPTFSAGGAMFPPAAEPITPLSPSRNPGKSSGPQAGEQEAPSSLSNTVPSSPRGSTEDKASGYSTAPAGFMTWSIGGSAPAQNSAGGQRSGFQVHLPHHHPSNGAPPSLVPLSSFAARSSMSYPSIAPRPTSHSSLSSLQLRHQTAQNQHQQEKQPGTSAESANSSGSCHTQTIQIPATLSSMPTLLSSSTSALSFKAHVRSSSFSSGLPSLLSGASISADNFPLSKSGSATTASQGFCEKGALPQMLHPLPRGAASDSAVPARPSSAMTPLSSVAPGSNRKRSACSDSSESSPDQDTATSASSAKRSRRNSSASITSTFSDVSLVSAPGQRPRVVVIQDPSQQSAPQLAITTGSGIAGSQSEQSAQHGSQISMPPISTSFPSPPSAIVAPGGQKRNPPKLVCEPGQYNRYISCLQPGDGGHKVYFCSFPHPNGKGICGRTDARKSNVACCAAGHTGERPWVCPKEGCGYRARQSAHMRGHCRSKHWELGF